MFSERRKLRRALKQYLRESERDKPPWWQSAGVGEPPDKAFLQNELSEDNYRKIKALTELDITVRPIMFLRTPFFRVLRIANLGRKIAGSLFKEVPYLSDRDLMTASPKVQKAYRGFLRELYEMAALMEVFDKPDGPLGAIAKWQEYLHYAQGHPDEENRIRLARKHLNKLMGIQDLEAEQ